MQHIRRPPLHFQSQNFLLPPTPTLQSRVFASVGVIRGLKFSLLCVLRAFAVISNRLIRVKRVIRFNSRKWGKWVKRVKRVRRLRLWTLLMLKLVWMVKEAARPEI